MASETWFQKAAREAGERVVALLALPLPGSADEAGGEGIFDPWSLFPLYGTYSSEFDDCALAVLRGLGGGGEHRNDLAAEFFREMLCNLHLCDYGTSPRACFPTEEFRQHLPALIQKWKIYAGIVWA